MIEFGLLVLKKKIFETFQCNFTILLLYPLGEGLSSLFEQKLNPLPLRMICAKFG
jgi:hypothetical protein